MAKGKSPSVRRRGYDEFEMSPSSEYFLYGKGGSEDYAREIRRVKTELREAIYGDYYDYEKEAEELNRKLNLSALILIVLSIATVVVTLLGKLVGASSVFFLAENADGITLIIGCVDALSGAKPSSSVLYTGLFTLIGTLLSVIIILGSAVNLRKRGVGKVMKLSAVLSFAVSIATVITELMDMQSVPIGIMLITVLAFVRVVIAFMGGKKKRR